MVDYTSHFRFGIPDFNQDPWHEDFETLVRLIDNVLYQLAIAESVTIWANDTVYDVSDLVLDNVNGILYTAATAHTSSAAPTTFAQERVAFPNRWNPTANIPQQRGNWQTGETYNMGDFVVESNRYAVCVVGHVAGVFNTDLAAGKWAVLIDLGGLSIGINSEPEDTIASGATVDLGSISSSRIFVTGNTTITSFGNVANLIKILRYEQALTVTHHATDLILPAGQNRVTDAGGIQIVSSSSTGKWRELNWHPGSGPAAVPIATTTQQGVIEIATAAETQALTDNTRAVSPLGLASALSDLSTSILNTIRAGVSSSLDTLAEIATAIGLLAPKASPAFTGTPTINGVGVFTAGPSVFASTGSGTYNTPANARWLRVRLRAGGGGGGDSEAQTGAAGGASQFHDVTVAGGSPGAGAGGNGGSGGSNGASGFTIVRINGGSGGAGSNTQNSPAGGDGGGAGGGGAGVGSGGHGKAGAVNSGGGGGGGGRSAGSVPGGGGGEGEYAEIWINNPAASYAFSVGAGGAGAIGAQSNGGNGGNGLLIVEAFFGP